MLESLESRAASTSHIFLSFSNLLMLSHNVGTRIQLMGIPAHCGILGSEIVNTFTKQSVDSGSPFDICLPKIYLNPFLNKRLLKNWQLLWNQSSLAKGSHLLFFYTTLHIPTTPFFFFNS